MSKVVDWGLAERVSAAMIAGLPGRDDAPPARYTAAEVETACAEAIETAAASASVASALRAHARRSTSSATGGSATAPSPA